MKQLRCDRLLTVVALITTFAGALAAADDGSPEVEFAERAAEYEFKDLSTGAALTMRPQPLLHWGNPARNSEDGAVFLWTKDEVPGVIGTCFTYKYREALRRKHAFLVLTDAAIEGRHRDRVIWTPAEKSLVHRPIPRAPTPAAGPSGRNSQLKLLARRFRVQMTHRDGRQEQCRLVPQPLYRFHMDRSDGTPGAIFRFAIGTDPEALLLLDQRVDSSGKPAWHYALARFTFYRLEGFLDDESVWKLDESESLQANILSRPDYQREPYVTFKPDWLD